MKRGWKSARYHLDPEDEARKATADPVEGRVGIGVSAADWYAVQRQLGRPARGLPDGTPFPTTYYATCPRLTGAVSTLEGRGLMRTMQERLASDPGLATAYRGAHEDYLARRAELGVVPELEGISAGGMPTRVKCLHALAAHALAAGPGVNPLGDEVLAALGPWWEPASCAADLMRSPAAHG